MGKVRILLALFICFSLLAGNVASAAMLGCCGQAETAQSNVSSKMPCHDVSDENSNTENKHDCSKCGCQDCAMTSALPTLLPEWPSATISSDASSKLVAFNPFSYPSIENPPKR